MNESLTSVLSQIGKATDTYEAPDGSQLLLLPYGARVLGLYAPGSEENFFWTHPALEEVESARSLYGSNGWHNSGGDRTWLAPEVDIFFPDFPNTRNHRPPDQLEAEDYSVTSTENGVRMEKGLAIYFARAECEVRLHLVKTVSPAVNPLRCEPDMKDVMKPVRYAGYTQLTSLQLIDTEVEVEVGLWNLIQMRLGGEILVPTYHKTTPRILFGHIGPPDLTASDRLVRFKTRVRGEHKIAIRAVATTGRAGYLYTAGSESTLVIRNFFVNPSGEYVDCPKDDFEDRGYAFQAVNVNSELGEFCEIEYHMPALGKRSGLARCDDLSQVWAFRGAQQAIESVGRKLLSPEI